MDNSFNSYERSAISVRTAGLLPIEECRNHNSFKNESTEWKQLCIEGINIHNQFIDNK